MTEQEKAIDAITAKALQTIRVPAMTTDVLAAVREACRVGVAVAYDTLTSHNPPPNGAE